MLTLMLMEIKPIILIFVNLDALLALLLMSDFVLLVLLVSL